MIHRLRDHGQGSAGAMQRRHTDPLHQQTPVGDAPGRPHLPTSVGPLAMAKESRQCHLHGGRMRSSACQATSYKAFLSLKALSQPLESASGAL